jgi:hypothetical protein
MSAGCGCGQWLKRQYAEQGIEAVVTDVPPIFPTGYEQLGMACPHGVAWYTEPTREQIIRWQQDGVW